MNTWVIASNNGKKIEEMRNILQMVGCRLINQGELGIESADENGISFIENALIKARHAAKESGLPAIADDSGLCVPALGGKPGVYSARYAGVHATDEDNNEKLLAEMRDLKADARKAYFVCLIVAVRHAKDPLPLIAQGIWQGEIAATARGKNGFGYDPLFYLKDKKCSSAELGSAEKNRISHRARALKQLQEILQKHGV